MTVLAAALTVVALVLARPDGRWLVRERLPVSGWSLHHASWAPSIGTVGAVVVVSVGVPPARLVVMITACGVGWFVMRQVQAERARRRAMKQRDAVAEALGLMAAELRAGVLPRRVVTSLALDFPFLEAAARTADLGGDVSSALLTASREPGRELLVDLAGAWMVAERSGAPLARILDRLEASTRDDREIEREVQAGVSPARATGRLMAVLPLVGLMMGSGMGADPVALLTGTLPGALCLAAGATCACVGVAWVNRIAAAAERPR